VSARTRFLIVWGPAIAQMAIIFASSSVSDLSGLPGGVSDHAAHFLGYALLGALMLRAMASAQWQGVTGGAAAAAIVVSAAYAFTDELHQRFVPGRTAAVDDWVADALGAVAGALAVMVVAAFVRRGKT